ncbi:TPA: hypothetical protein HA251_04690 [Candidatus Woesearchaeota archaeon]|nr:hypothetical protein [Candidatus Woesearchaeota archaeon]
MRPLEVLVTLAPDLPHYRRFARDSRVDGIRFNTAMEKPSEMPMLLRKAIDESCGTPLYLDVKGRQLRVTKVGPAKDHLECYLNHPVDVKTPTPVLFKSGADGALLDHLEDDGYKLVFQGGPRYNLNPGESLHIRHPSLAIKGPLFTEDQLQFLAAGKEAGIDKYMLSYVGSMGEIDALRAIVGDAHITAKIEDKKGLDFVKNSYVKTPNLGLLTARGDLFVEVDKPHQIMTASQNLVDADPDAILGSRILLSMSEGPVPSCSDINEVGMLVAQGYYRFMFCDGICLNEDHLSRAIDVLRATYDDCAAKYSARLAQPSPRAMYATKS